MNNEANAKSGDKTVNGDHYNEGWQRVGSRRGGRGGMVSNNRGGMGGRGRGGYNSRSNMNGGNVGMNYAPVKTEDKEGKFDEGVVANEVKKSGDNVKSNEGKGKGVLGSSKD